MDELSEEDKVTVQRARRIQQFLGQNFFVAEKFTGLPGSYVPLTDTIEAFERICNGEFDHYPEQAFNGLGGLDDVEAAYAEDHRRSKGHRTWLKSPRNWSPSSVTLWSGKATFVTAQTTEGEIGVLPGHEPLFGQLVDNGAVSIKTVDGAEASVAAVQGGFLSVSQTKISILADKAVSADEVNVSEAEAHLDSDDPEVKARAESEVRAARRASEAR